MKLCDKTIFHLFEKKNHKTKLKRIYISRQLRYVYEYLIFSQINATKFIAHLNVNKVKASKNCPPQGFQTRQQLLATINSENSVSKNFPRIFVYRQQRKGQWFVSRLVVRIIIVYENLYLRRSVLYRASSS